MDSRINLADLRRFYEIDVETIALLKENKAFLFQEFVDALYAFYMHYRPVAGASSPYQSDESLAYSREYNERHWQIMIEGRFDAEYERSVEALHNMRGQLGFEPRWCPSGYNFVIAWVVEAIALRLPAKGFEIWRKRRCAALQAAYMRITMLDMSYIVDVYIHGTLSERQRTLSHLAESFETAVAGIASGVAAAAERLRKTADALTHSADSTNLQSMAAATASKEAAANVEAAAAATGHLSHAIGQISAQVHESNQIAGRAAGEADRTQDAVHSLSEAADRIGGIIDLISNIAGQTNMLALNATIEAARAGAAGRGFAIVAQEVKGLAHATSKATSEIGAHVDGIQAATQHVASFITSVAKSTQQVSAIAIAAETAVAEQDAVTQEIARRVEEAARGTHAVTSNIVGVTETAANSSAAAKELLKSATDLTRQSEVLSKQVEDFLRTVRAA
ncbi:MAG: methyl-accepting chemotaxis protein [Methylovirgula sp.]